MTTIQAIEAIGIDPTIRNGRPYIIGTIVTVADVAMARLYHALDADGTAEWYGLSLPQVYAVLAAQIRLYALGLLASVLELDEMSNRVEYVG